MSQYKVLSEESTNVRISVQCFMCRTTKELLVSTAGFMAWKSGMLIQKAFPSVSADDRELLITNTCGSCFDAAWPEED